MKKIVAIIVVLLGLGLIGFGVYKYSQSQKPNAGLKVESDPPALVFVDNVQMGQTPVEKVLKAGEVSVKLIPVSTTAALNTYQTKVRLTANTYTVIKRHFGASDVESSGEIVNLEPQSAKVASLTVIASGPDAASVVLDGEPQGFTPLPIASIPAGDHQFVLSAPGFQNYQVEAKALIGYKLNVNVKMAGEIPEPVASAGADLLLPADKPATGSSVILKKPYVEIKDTPTGFLRVRQTPSTGAKELSQVKPGDRFSLLSSQSGWYQIKIDLEATSSGWISAQYADKFE